VEPMKRPNCFAWVGEHHRTGGEKGIEPKVCPKSEREELAFSEKETIAEKDKISSYGCQKRNSPIKYLPRDQTLLS